MTPGDIWNGALFTVGGESITVGAVLLALTLLGLGFFVSRTASRVVSRALAAAPA